MNQEDTMAPISEELEDQYLHNKMDSTGATFLCEK